MKVVCISDTHNQLDKFSIPEGDMLIHAGDATMHGELKELSKFAYDLSKLPHKHKIFVPGNHDFILEDQPALANDTLFGYVPDIYILKNKCIEIEGVKIYGSPVNSNIPGWAFYKKKHKADQVYNQIPQDIDILVTHEPPHGIGDYVFRKKDHEESNNIGNKQLRATALNRPNLKLHVYGHIHESYGARNIQGVHFVNASLLDRKYKPVNKPIIVNL